MLQWRCDCCGCIAQMPQYADEQGISEPDMPPEGWRTIYTVINEHDGNRAIDLTSSQVSHSCKECNRHMSVEEHLEAEHDNRQRCMSEQNGG